MLIKIECLILQLSNMEIEKFKNKVDILYNTKAFLDCLVLEFERISKLSMFW